MAARIESLACMILLILVLLTLAVAEVQSIENKDQWDDAFKDRYATQDPLLEDPGQYPGELFAWQGHYWLRAYLSIAKTYGDTKYMDKAVALIEHMFHYRDDARQACGELDMQNEPYDSAPIYYLIHRAEAAPGWRRPFSGQSRIEVLTDGMITQAIMRFVDLVGNDPRFSGYQAKAEIFTKKVEETANIWNDNFVYNRFHDVPGSYYYPKPDGSGLSSGDVPYNHAAAMACTLLLLDNIKVGGTEYREKAEAILNYWKMHVRLVSNDAYDWNYHLRKPGDEDFTHGHIDMTFFNLAHRIGLLGTEDMPRLANTLTKNIYKGGGRVANDLNGSGSGEPYVIGLDWIDLTRFNPQILGMAKETYRIHYSHPTWSRLFLGWAEILRWSASLGDSLNPPLNLHIMR